MKRSLASAILLSFSVILSAQITFPVNDIRDPDASLFFITNVQIHQDAKTLLKDAEMLIQDGKILEIGTKLNRPANAVIKNLNGAHIYPAFIEAYSDFGVSVKKSGSSNQAVSTREGAFSWNEALRSDLKASQSFVYNPDEASKLREAGFACVHTHYADGISRGSSALALLNDKNEHESLLKNELCHMMSFQKGNSSQDYPGSLMGSIALLRQAYYDGRQYLTTIKPKETNLSIEAWNQLMNLPTIFSVTDKLDLLRAAAIAKEFNTQYIYKTAGDEYQRIQEIKQLNSPLIVPLVFPELFDVTDPYDALQIDLADLKHWEMAPSNAAILEKNGLKFCLSASGQKDVKSFLSKVKKAIQHGLSQEYALYALTLGPAELLKVNDMVGTLHKGKLANFIVSPTELFDEQGKINATWVQGKEFSYSTPALNLVAGEYELEVGEERIKLEFQNNTASNNEWKIVSKDSNTDIQAKFQPDYLNGKWIKKSKEVLLFSASKTGNDWIGKAFNSQGEWKDFVIRFKAIKQVDRVADSSSAKTSISTGSLWYPNMAYGWTEKPKAKTYLIKNTTVWTCEQAGILSNTDVLISDGKIKSIGKSIAAPEAIVIDGTNKHLTPGIIDEHSHIAISKGVNECTQANTAEVRIADVVNCDDINIYRQLSGGVTTSHLLHGSCNPIGGQTTLIKLRWGSSPEEMKYKSYDGFIKFALGENVKRSTDPNNSRYPNTRMGVEQVYLDAFSRAKDYDAARKQNPNSIRRDLELDALAEILNKKRFITCHSYVQSEINMLMKVADRFGFTVNTFTHILEGYKVADIMKKHGAGASSFSDWWAYKYEVYEAIPYNGAILHNQSVVTAYNSDDAEMARRLNQEAAKAITYGKLKEEDAIKFVTINPARLLHIDQQTGSIATGKDADLVLWNNHPLSVYATAEATFVDGIKYFDKQEDLLLRKKNAEERARIIQKMCKLKNDGTLTIPYSSPKKILYHCDTVEEEDHSTHSHE